MLLLTLVNKHKVNKIEKDEKDGKRCLPTIIAMFEVIKCFSYCIFFSNIETLKLKPFLYSHERLLSRLRSIPHHLRNSRNTCGWPVSSAEEGSGPTVTVCRPTSI